MFYTFPPNWWGKAFLPSHLHRHLHKLVQNELISRNLTLKKNHEIKKNRAIEENLPNWQKNVKLYLISRKKWKCESIPSLSEEWRAGRYIYTFPLGIMATGKVYLYLPSWLNGEREGIWYTSPRGRESIKIPSQKFTKGLYKNKYTFPLAIKSGVKV